MVKEAAAQGKPVAAQYGSVFTLSLTGGPDGTAELTRMLIEAVIQ
jgi:hypothetical protein